MKIAILGTGKMGSAIGRALVGAGHEVVYGSRTPEVAAPRVALFGATAATWLESTRNADAAIIAVPWAVVRDLATRLSQPLAGKVVIDVTNPLSPDMSSLAVGGADSAGEQVARILSDSLVVKAMNCVIADQFADPSFSGVPAQMFYCSDHEVGRTVAHQLIEGCGYRAVGCGSLSNARYLEALAVFWLQLAYWEEWGTAFRIELAGQIP